MVAMTQKLRIAVCQFPVSHNLASNAKFICRFMKKAAEAAAHIIHFPETALSGYGRSDFTPLSTDNWQSLEAHTEEIVDQAGKLGLWVVLGSCRKVIGKEKPANCIRIISNQGQMVGTYDKQKLLPKETDWYTQGKGLRVITINGLKCGFLICYEACFPRLFEAYGKQGVQIIFHACHNVSGKPKADLQELGLAQIRTRAADYQMWLCGANSSARHAFSKACIARPDGSMRSLRRHQAGILVQDFPDEELGWTYSSRKEEI
jgi:predicted amidohydrolase